MILVPDKNYVNFTSMTDYPKILFPYAYNILGSAEDAKDAVQDVMTKHLADPREGIENIKGYLVKSVINQSLNIKKKKKRVVRNENWLPEPFATEEADSDLHLRDIASYSLLVLLEKLNPKERAVFILKEGFGYSHEEIAEVLSGTVENSRKLLSRARQKVSLSKVAKTTTGQSNPFEAIEKYITAIRQRDTNALELLLCDDITFFADGGDKINVVKKVCAGINDVLNLVVFIFHKFNADSEVAYSIINHQPALLYFDNGNLKTCQVFDVSAKDKKIMRINTILDPGKLKALDSIKIRR